MKTIKNSKEITTLEVGDKIIFGDLEYVVTLNDAIEERYYLCNKNNVSNDQIFKNLHIVDIRSFIEKLGIICEYYDRTFSSNSLPHPVDFPETHSLEALTAIVSALFKEYEKQNSLPQTWEEFCINYPMTSEEVYISSDSDICSDFYTPGRKRNSKYDKNIMISKEEGDAFIALMQLRQLRKAYVKNWEPNWRDNMSKYTLIHRYNGFQINNTCYSGSPLSFPTYDLAKRFLNNFRNLLEIAKPLL